MLFLVLGYRAVRFLWPLLVPSRRQSKYQSIDQENLELDSRSIEGLLQFEGSLFLGIFWVYFTNQYVRPNQALINNLRYIVGHSSEIVGVANLFSEAALGVRINQIGLDVIPTIGVLFILYLTVVSSVALAEQVIAAPRGASVWGRKALGGFAIQLSIIKSLYKNRREATKLVLFASILFLYVDFKINQIAIDICLNQNQGLEWLRCLVILS